MVCTTRISPITVITVVEVVGVMPSMQTSLGLPVLRHTSDSCASGLSGFPVMTINFSFGFRLCANCVSSTISRVLPELEISSSRSFSCRIPRSPCCASLGCRNTEGMPVLFVCVRYRDIQYGLRFFLQKLLNGCYHCLNFDLWIISLQISVIFHKRQ